MLLAFLLVAVRLCGSAAAQQQAAAADLTIVRSTSELGDALRNGRAHIEIQQHLDLTAEPRAASLLNFKPLYPVAASTQSLRGNCTDPVHLLPASGQLRPRQCVLMTAERIVQATPDETPHLFWWDNIYIISRPSTRGELTVPLYWDHPGNKLWVTNTTFQGDRTNSSALVAGRGCNVYGGGLKISEMKTGYSATEVEGETGTLVLEDVVFDPLEARDLVASYLRVGNGASAVLYNTTFPDGPVYHVNAYNGSVYADNYASLYMLEGRDYPAKPLSELPNNVTFLSQNDPELRQIQQASLRGRTLPGSVKESATESGTAAAPAAAAPIRSPQGGSVVSAASRSQAGESNGETGTSSSSGTAPIVGGTVGAVALVGVLVVALLLWRRRGRRKPSGSTEAVTSKEYQSAGGSIVGMPAPVFGDLNDTLAASTATTSTGNDSIQNAQYTSQQPQPLGPWASSRSTGASTPSSGGTARWLATPPPTAGQPTTTYTSSHATGGDTSAVIALLATQRRAPTIVGIMSAETKKEQLERALRAMASSQPPELFIGTFLVMQQRRSGGQATVQFARGGDGGFFQYAIKFFHRPEDFAIEERLYNNPEVKSTLPELFAAGANSDGTCRARSGFVFPPFLVMERGMTLAEWVQQGRDALAILSMFKDCAALLARLHAAGQVHRDVKPDNVLLMLQTQAWRLIDFGIAAPIGQEAPPQCTLGYAAPEVVVAFDEKRTVAVAPAQDVWALGVMVFDAFTQKPAVDPSGGVDGCKALAHGELQYPWEAHVEDEEFSDSSARQLVESCLARDPAQRPTAAALVEAVGMISKRKTSS